SGGTESDNLAIRGVIGAARGKNRRCHVITSAIEHPAVLRTCEAMEREGCDVTYLKSGTDGAVRPGELKNALRPETVLVSVMLANNETGVIQPIAEITELTRGKGIILHTDAVQGVGKIPVDVDELGADLLSISAHKFYGPKGIGAIYVRRGAAIEPAYTGGGQENGLRPGTLNVPGIVGFGEACRITKDRLPSEMARIGELRDRLESGLRDRVDDLLFNGIEAPRVPNTSSVAVPRIEGEAITLNLSMLGFAVSSGSACASGSSEASQVLVSMGLDPADAQGGVRISLGIENTKEEIESFVDAFAGVVDRLRKLSPLGRHTA
ncbi:MAG TPA: cysteine desulfurase, partial [Candidatus Eisenbacteria bacterium]|nr:cysteine desulfurase [Candidatus Eisenbacteria bacterium]